MLSGPARAEAVAALANMTAAALRPGREVAVNGEHKITSSHREQGSV